MVQTILSLEILLCFKLITNIITTVDTTNLVVQTVQKWSNGHP